MIESGVWCHGDKGSDNEYNPGEDEELADNDEESILDESDDEAPSTTVTKKKKKKAEHGQSAQQKNMPQEDNENTKHKASQDK